MKNDNLSLLVQNATSFPWFNRYFHHEKERKKLTYISQIPYFAIYCALWLTLFHLILKFNFQIVGTYYLLLTKNNGWSSEPLKRDVWNHGARVKPGVQTKPGFKPRSGWLWNGKSFWYPLCNIYALTFPFKKYFNIFLLDILFSNTSVS